jgi:D-beta-D-heptose 7-phosphate kinase / D-beta-D-heptose 1-phosphate adenosyltransferase
MKILVFGDLMLDKYIICKSRKINSECPNIVFDNIEEKNKLGGAANVCNNLSSLDIEVYILSAIGNDTNSDLLIDLLNKNKNNTKYIIKTNKPTILKTRYLCNNTQVFRVDKEDISPISTDIQEQLFNNFETIIENNKINGLLISDYDKGVVVSDLLKKIISICCQNNIPVLVDPKINDFEKYKNSTILKPNRNEFNKICEYYKIENKLDIKSLKTISNILNLKYLLVTLDKDGMLLYDREKERLKNFKIENMKNHVADVTGAGDIVLSSLAYYFLKNNDIDSAVTKANKIGAYSVTISGCFVLSKNFLKEVFNQNKLINIKDIDLINRNKKIVFTNGCFDILHSGHLEYLKKSKKLGDLLIIGLNSDNSVKRLKGEDRPINLELDRAYILSGLECVDYIIIFDEDTPYNLIKELKPNILVKGGDYKKENVVGKDLVDELVLIDFKKGYSTSNIINKFYHPQ